MTNQIIPVLVVSISAAATLGGLAQDIPTPAEQLAQAKVAAGIAAAQEDLTKFDTLKELVAVVRPLGDQKVRGTVRFQKLPEGIKLIAQFEGLEPGSKHGFHLHEFGDLSAAGALSAGDHFNPDESPHGMPDSESHHAGDFGNLTADDKGMATVELTLKNLSLAGEENPILGRTVIVHSKQDDGSQPSGNSGDRIAAGVVGISMANAPDQPAPQGAPPTQRTPEE